MYYLSLAHLMRLLAIDVTALPALAHLLLQLGQHLLSRGKLNLSRIELERESHLHIKDLCRYHIEGQSDECHCWMINVDHMLPQWLHKVIDNLNAHIRAQAGETILIAGAVHHMIEALAAAILEDGPRLGEPFHIWLLRHIAHEGGVGRVGQMMTEKHMFRCHSHVIRNIHATGPGADNQNILICA